MPFHRRLEVTIGVSQRAKKSGCLGFISSFPNISYSNPETIEIALLLFPLAVFNCGLQNAIKASLSRLKMLRVSSMICAFRFFKTTPIKGHILFGVFCYLVSKTINLLLGPFFQKLVGSEAV